MVITDPNKGNPSTEWGTIGRKRRQVHKTTVPPTKQREISQRRSEQRNNETMGTWKRELSLTINKVKNS